jgi:predicted DNA-binding transcriptional regulator YafY
MTRTARLYRIELLIKARGHLSFRALLDELGVSAATLKRDLEYLRDRLNAPIEYDRYLNGYKFASGSRGRRHELPGLWFDERELYSLLMTQQLLSELDAQGTLSHHLEPLLARVHELLGTTCAEVDAIVRRVRVISPARRPVPPQNFDRVCEALVQRRRLALRYYSRSRGEVGEREVSPQRLVHYRHTWYTDAWCHRSQGLRRFALDAIEDATVLAAPAQEVPLEQVEAAMDGGYGIYAGSQTRWVTLVFQPRAAQWVSREQWHPRQRGAWRDDGCYMLEVPYADETELLMDVLRHGDQVEVIQPGALREAVQRRLAAALAAYAAGVSATEPLGLAGNAGRE